MGRPKSKEKLHVFVWNKKTHWYCWFIDESGRKVFRSTGYSTSEYSKEQVQRIINNVTGSKQTSKYSIEA